ncbi:MAG: hypothetical protein VCD33_13630 [Alphaproteobacteria bacterium]
MVVEAAIACPDIVNIPSDTGVLAKKLKTSDHCIAIVPRLLDAVALNGVTRDEADVGDGFIG